MAEAAAEKPGFRKLIASLGQRKTGIMFVFGFSAGLPYALLLGTLYAWLSDAKVDLETMGVFSLIGLAYAFKFLWVTGCRPVEDSRAAPAGATKKLADPGADVSGRHFHNAGNT